MPTVEFDPDLGQRRRTGPLASRATPIVDDIEAALASGSFAQAALLIDHFMELAAVRFASYNRGRWLKCREWLLANGTPAAELDSLERQVSTKLAPPDENRYRPDELWEELSSFAGTLVGRTRIASPADHEALVRDVETLRAQWQDLHDRSVDFITEMLAFVVRTHGEPSLGDCMGYIIEGSIGAREDARLFLERVLAGMVGHLSGPKRRGAVQVEEHEDRWVLSFEPCGSGGRTYLPTPGHRVDQTDMNDKVLGRHDWAWNTPGVCYYCTHCAVGLQSGPIDAHGVPLADVYPPSSDAPAGSTSALCQYVIYKRDDAIPDAVYERVGRARRTTKKELDREHG
ncbi:hypothetical protein [Okibacterium endophyticum]